MDSSYPAALPSDAADTPDVVRFFLNGQPVTLPSPSPDLLLIDFLRSPEVGLIGPKKPCGQGGCGGCTVILSHWNEGEEKVEHSAINSCLRPVVALDGLVVRRIWRTARSLAVVGCRLTNINPRQGLKRRKRRRLRSAMRCSRASKSRTRPAIAGRIVTIRAIATTTWM
jgi:hypothetical protein